MIHSAEEFLRLRLSKNTEEYLRAAHEPASEETWIEVINSYPEMRMWVAHNKTIPKKILGLLAEDLDPHVRSTVARRRSAGDDILNQLACDPNESVRLSVACNPKVSKNILLELLDDEWENIVEVAKEKLEKLKELTK